MTDTLSNSTVNGDELPIPCTKAASTLSIDWEVYAQYLDESDLSEAQKRELVEALWSIVVNFVDLGFGIAPTQAAMGAAQLDAPKSKSTKQAFKESCAQDAPIKKETQPARKENRYDI